jgi:hypothetical protein
MASNSHTPENYNAVRSRRRRLKGVLALLPETVAWYPYKHSARQCDSLTSPYESSAFSSDSVSNKKITSRKQQRRLLKRFQLDAATSSTDMEQGGGSLLSNCFPRETISLADHLHDMDVAVLFLFDPYQPYSVHLLQKLISLCHLAHSASVEIFLESPFDNNLNAENDSSQGIAMTYGATTASSQPPNFVRTDREAVVNGIEQESQVKQRSPQLHCLVVTPCTDMMIVNRLLDNSGVILIPWTQDHSWRMATGSDVCPSIVGVYECRQGQKLFTAHLEELALEWNTSIQVLRAWLHDRISAMTFLQRVQGHVLHPTASMCIIQ